MKSIFYLVLVLDHGQLRAAGMIPDSPATDQLLRADPFPPNRLIWLRTIPT
jgi:hypothetical protein